jgi:hypothetical protein
MESLFVLFVFCYPTDNFDVGAHGWVFMFADFGEVLCSLLLAILDAYCDNAVWWKKGDLHRDGSNM